MLRFVLCPATLAAERAPVASYRTAILPRATFALRYQRFSRAPFSICWQLCRISRALVTSGEAWFQPFWTSGRKYATAGNAGAATITID